MAFYLQLCSRTQHLSEELLGSESTRPKAAVGLGPRRDDRLLSCRKALKVWRQQCWDTHFSDCIFGEETILSEKMLTTLASAARIKTLEDLKAELSDWAFADQFGYEVLAILQEIDRAWLTNRTEKHQARKRIKTEGSATFITASLEASTSQPVLQPVSQNSTVSMPDNPPHPSTSYPPPSVPIFSRFHSDPNHQSVMHYSLDGSQWLPLPLYPI